MDPKIILSVLFAVMGIAATLVGFSKSFKSKGAAKFFVILLGLAILFWSVPGIIFNSGAYTPSADVGQWFLASSSVTKYVPSSGGTTTTGSTNTGGTVVTYQPTAGYATQDKYSTTSVSGTSYYKSGVTESDSKITGPIAATTTAISNIAVGSKYAYWVENSTYWVKPFVFDGAPTVNAVNKEVWANGTGSITLYDSINNVATGGSDTNNVSMGANDQATLELTYQGTNKQSAVPFGGALVIEYNSTISSVSCTGDGLVGPNSKYQVTYTPSSTSNTFKQYELEKGFDDGKGTVRKLSCQFQNGATAAGAGSAYYFKIIPANYYVANDGNIYLDTEKAADDSTTRVGSVNNLPSETAYWAA